MASPTAISINQLARLIGTPDRPEIVDLRIDEDFESDPRLIPGGFRHPFAETAALARRLQGRRAVIYCHKGLKISQGAAAILRDEGVEAETLEGGHVAWAEAGRPLLALDKLPPANAEGRTVWVTRHRPKIDRFACPWLIRRFVDPNAQFLFVSPSQVMNVAERFAATPFDLQGVFWSHRGERCTFDVMIEEFGLATEPLLRLAAIVRGADTDRLDLAPEAAGLRAASLGLSRIHRDDLAQLEASFALYDAFYRWARDAADEGHDWPPPRPRG